jgi:dolichyl-phosphate beta-glucosyltransferase
VPARHGSHFSGADIFENADFARMAAPQLSLVIPAFNEARRLPESIRRVAQFCANSKWSCEALAIIEKSTDDTLELASRAASGSANIEIVDNRVHRGKGYAVRCGMLRARGDVVFYMDADLSTPLEDVVRFMEFLESHPEVDVLAGNRQHASSEIVKRQSLLRQTMGKTFNSILRILAPVRLRDTQCGFKAFRREAARAVFTRQKLDGFAFDVEALMLAERLGFRVVDLPVRWLNSPDSKVHIVRDSLRMLADAMRVRGLVEASIRGQPISVHDTISRSKTS